MKWPACRLRHQNDLSGPEPRGPLEVGLWGCSEDDHPAYVAWVAERPYLALSVSRVSRVSPDSCDEDGGEDTDSSFAVANLIELNT